MKWNIPSLSVHFSICFIKIATNYPDFVMFWKKIVKTLNWQWNIMKAMKPLLTTRFFGYLFERRGNFLEHNRPGFSKC